MTPQAPTMSQMLASFYSHLESLSADRNCQGLKSILNENTSLTESNKRLRAAYDEIRHTCNEKEGDLEDQERQCQVKNDALAELQEARDADVKRLQEGKAAAEAMLKEKEAELKGSSALMTAVQNSLKQREVETEKLKRDLLAEQARCARLRETERQLKQAKDELGVAQDDLGRLRGFTVAMEALKVADVTPRLHTIYKAAYSLADHYFNVPFDTALFEDASKWTPLRDAARHPVPASNTPTAKQMRTAAVLALLGRQLVENVFQPTYLLPAPASGPLSGLMRRLADGDADRESHLRSVLLRAAGAQERRALGGERVGEVVRNVSAAVDGIVPAGGKVAFLADLEKVCQAALGQWLVVQQLSRRVQPELRDIGEEWDIFPGPSHSPRYSGSTASTAAAAAATAAIAVGEGLANGRDTLPADGGHQHQAGTQGKAKREATPGAGGVRDAADVAHIVWPCFVALLGHEEEELLANGVCLSRGQVEAARAEHKTAHPARKRGERSRAPPEGANGSGGGSFLGAGRGGGGNGVV